jgi:hypothetical protein
MSPPISGFKSKQVRNHHEEGRSKNIFLRNVGWFSTDYTSLCGRRYTCNSSLVQFIELTDDV